MDTDLDWVMGMGGFNNDSSLNWTTTDNSINADSGEKLDSNVIFWKNPEEMLNPAKRNPIFYHIIVTHAVTFFVGIGNLIAVL